MATVGTPARRASQLLWWLNITSSDSAETLVIHLPLLSSACTSSSCTVIYIYIWICCCMQGLVPWPGIEPRVPALRDWSLSHWTTRKSLSSYGFCLFMDAAALWLLFTPCFHTFLSFFYTFLSSGPPLCLMTLRLSVANFLKNEDPICWSVIIQWGYLSLLGRVLTFGNHTGLWFHVWFWVAYIFLDQSAVA